MPFKVTKKNASALEPLFKPWEEPSRYRSPNPEPGGAALISPGRRPSTVPLVRGIRAEVDEWRRGGYGGVSETSRTLLNHWFNNDHRVRNGAEDLAEFHYHWAQREAIETIIYLYELRHIRSVAELMFEFGDDQVADLALGIPPEEDRWPKDCCKVATGAGKTKVMSLAIAWSYFHSLYESGSTLARHFVIIAPNLTVYERLRTDFEDGNIFYRDPVFPDEQWKRDFQVQVILQDEAGGASANGAIYLTNIHRLYENRGKGPAGGENANSLLGPEVPRTRALDTSATLRDRISSHSRLMVLNDEAHHLHDPELRWNEVVGALHDQSLSKGNEGICLQLDFSATPKHTDGKLFSHIVCDFPLGEAVDAGIVKVPVLGESEDIQEHGDKSAPAHERFETHLKLGYQAYQRAFEEWHRVRKPVLFVMTEDAEAANDIAGYLDSDEFPLLKGRVLNIHTRLKGGIRAVQRGGKEVKEFIENENAMKPDDLQVIREWSRDLDSPDSKFRCVVSVMMLREGWDVRNVTTIVPLRPYSAKAGILPEQTLGRGLRRMEPFGDKPETVVVIHHPAFRKLYEQELAQEGVDVAFLPVRDLFRQTVTIYVDHDKKAVDELEIEIPLVSEAISTAAELDDLTFEEIRDYFYAHFRPLPIGERKIGKIEYVERHLFTDEVVARMELDAGLLSKGWSAPSYFAQMLAKACHLSGSHKVLAPLIERFISEVLFGQKVDLYSGEVDHRMRDLDVVEHVRATFAPLITARTVRRQERHRLAQNQKLSLWKPYQATSNEKRPALQAARTMFNLVPCANDFEQAFVDFLETAKDVAAFAKNAGPQKLLIDYLSPAGQRALYEPDFIVRLKDGSYSLTELKGREDPLVPMKASAAVEWCKAASAAGPTWDYLYVPYHLFQQSAVSTAGELARACEPSLQGLLKEAQTGQQELPLREAVARKESDTVLSRLLGDAGIPDLGALPFPVAEAVRQAIQLLDYADRSGMHSLGHAFQPLLSPFDEYALRILDRCLTPRIPKDPQKRQAYFAPYIDSSDPGQKSALERNGRYLRDNLLYGRSIMKLGTLLFCLKYAEAGGWGAPGVWEDVRDVFGTPELLELYPELDQVNTFRNMYVAHSEAVLTDATQAWNAMVQWVRCLWRMVSLA